MPLGWEETYADLGVARPRHRRPARRDRLGAAARERDASSPARRARPRPRRGPRRSPPAGSSRSSSATPRRATPTTPMAPEASPTSTGVDAEAAKWDAAMAAEADEPGRDRVRRPPERRQVVACSTRSSARTGRSSRTSRARPATRSTPGWRGAAARSSSSTRPGIRRRGKVAGGPAAEKYSTLRALQALSRADVAVLVIDAVEGLTAQDAHVAGYVVEEGKGLVIAVNKWDLVEDKTDRTFDQYVEWIRNEVPFLDFAPIVSISAKTGQRVGRVLEAAIDIWGERRKRISTGELNRVLPPRPSGRRRRRSAAAGRSSSTRRRPRSRRRRSCSSPRTRRRSTSATGATSRTGCARRSASTARRSGSSSATGRRSSCRAARSCRSAAGRVGQGAASRDGAAGTQAELTADAADGRSARRGRRGRRLGDDAGAGRRPGRAGHAPVPLPGDGGTDRARPDGTRRDCPGVDLPATVIADRRPGRARGRHRPRRSSPRRRRICGRRSRRVAPFLAPGADLLSVVKGLERGTLLRMSEVIAEAAGVAGRAGSPRCRARTSPPRSRATCRRRRSSRPRTSSSPSASSRGSARRRFRLYVNEDILGVELCGALEERRRHRGRRGRRARVRRQRQGRAADPRPGRDDAARDRGRREPADLRRAGRDGRPDRDLRLARCRATTGSARSWPRAGRGPRSRRRCPGTAEGAYTVQAALALADRLGVEMPIAREVDRALFEGKSVQRCLVDLLARESKDELADYGRWVARLEADAGAESRGGAASRRSGARLRVSSGRGAVW